MKLRNTISKLITVTIVLIALVVVSSTWARNGNVVNTFLYSVSSFGLVPDQTARISVCNLPQKEGSAPARVTTYIYDSYGNTVSRTDAAEVPAGHIHIIDINRNDLRVAGEPLTGRVQLRAGVQVVFADGSVRTVKDVSVSLEVMDNRTGATTSGGNYFTGTVSVSGD